eukprot:snap_masked-scaffold_6-processed-gene-0.27-mRNA-1 protein AED:1.00 eAED:1.00 QI:0/0/0/0/1/1/2/0/358
MRLNKRRAENNAALKTYLEKMDVERLSIMNPFYSGKWKRLTEAEIFKEPKKSEPDLSVLKRNGPLIVIPESLSHNIIVHNHIYMGHPSLSSELKELKRRYGIKLPGGFDLEKILKELHRRCIHCVRIPALIHTPYHETPLGDKRGAILRADFLHINAKGYVLVLMDDATRKFSLRYYKKCTARVEMEQWLRYSHSYAVSYAPWTNGGIEGSNVRILRILRSVASELHLSSGSWPEVLPYVQTVINMSRTRRNMDMTPKELYLGLSQEEQNNDEDFLIQRHLFINPDGTSKIMGARNPSNIVTTAREINKSIEDKQSAVYSFVATLRKKKNDRYNERFSRKVIQYNLGDWVMVSSANTH